MKAIKMVLASAALFLSVTAFSQTNTGVVKKDSTAAKDTSATSMQHKASGAVSDQLQAATTGNEPAAPKANFGRYYIPVLGTYQSARTVENNSQAVASGKTVTVTADESNAGKVWVEGLTPVKFYALLKSAPATYKVPVQKQDKTSVNEGTITYDDNSRQISICLGCGFSEDKTTAETFTNAPAGKNKSAVKSKTAKPTVISFTGTKAEAGTAGIH